MGSSPKRDSGAVWHCNTHDHLTLLTKRGAALGSCLSTGGGCLDGSPAPGIKGVQWLYTPNGVLKSLPAVQKAALGAPDLCAQAAQTAHQEDLSLCRGCG